MGTAVPPCPTQHAGNPVPVRMQGVVPVRFLSTDWHRWSAGIAGISVAKPRLLHRRDLVHDAHPEVAARGSDLPCVSVV